MMQTGYNSGTSERLNVYLTNTLNESSTLATWIPDFIADETKSAP